MRRRPNHDFLSLGLFHYALKERLSDELDRLEREGIVQKTKCSHWAAPIVTVPKGDGSLRVCGDYRVALNASLEVDQYPLPRPEDLFTSLEGGKYFSKIDLTHAYQQMVLEEKSRELVTINTHKGLYQYTRLPFEVASAPALFQQAMDHILQGIPNVICYLDDILVTGKSPEEHLTNLELVLKRLSEEGMTAKRSKCFFMEDSVEFLGHVISSKGIHPFPAKLEAIQASPKPENVKQLRSLLGLVNYDLYLSYLPYCILK